MQTIMLVDDNPEILECYKEILGTRGYRVVTQCSGSGALSVIQSGVAVDLVITDYRMPDMNGLDLMRQLRQTAPSIPVLMITGYVSVETYLTARSLGVIDYIQKPSSGMKLAGIVRTALKSAKLRNIEADHQGQWLSKAV